MTPPKRSEEPRRTDDAVVRALTSETLNQWLSTVAKRFIFWIVLSVVTTVATVSWAASAWATNQVRDVEAVKAEVASIQQDVAATNAALVKVTEQLGKTTTALDSLRITLQARGAR